MSLPPKKRIRTSEETARWRVAAKAKFANLAPENQAKVLAKRNERRVAYLNRTPAQRAANRQRENERYRTSSKEYHHARTKRYRGRLKAQVIEGYGGACTCCGEAESQFLTVDHKNGDGKAHRQTHPGTKLYRDIRDRGFPPEYTVLCFNCNIARSLFGVCPHQRTTEPGSPTAPQR